MGFILRDEDIVGIHQSSLEILEEVGVKFDYDIVLKRLADNGCSVDFDKKIAKIPESIVKKCLSLCPSSIKIANRNWESFKLCSKGVSIFLSGNALYIVEGKERYDITKGKFIELIKVYDGLSNLDGVVGVSLSDVPPPVRDIVGFKIMTEYTKKHLRPCMFTAENAEAIKDMADVVLDGHSYKDFPIFSLGYSICTPLHWTENALKLFVVSAGHSIPVTLNSECMLGGSSPVTLAGAITLGNAEILSGIVINQLFEEGRPVIYNMGFSHSFDMRTSLVLTGAPEVALMGTACADMANYYDLPSCAWVSTDSLVADNQAAYEHMFLTTIFILSGVNFIWGVGQVEAQLSLSKEQAVIHNEIINYVKRYVRGIEVNSETIALDTIKKVGIQGEFLTSEHTMKHFKKELSLSEIAWRDRRDTQKQFDVISMEERASKIANEMINRENIYITEKQREELDLIEKLWLRKYGY